MAQQRVHNRIQSPRARQRSDQQPIRFATLSNNKKGEAPKLLASLEKQSKQTRQADLQNGRRVDCRGGVVPCGNQIYEETYYPVPKSGLPVFQDTAAAIHDRSNIFGCDMETKSVTVYS